MGLKKKEQPAFLLHKKPQQIKTRFLCSSETEQFLPRSFFFNSCLTSRPWVVWAPDRSRQSRPWVVWAPDRDGVANWSKRLHRTCLAVIRRLRTSSHFIVRNLLGPLPRTDHGANSNTQPGHALTGMRAVPQMAYKHMCALNFPIGCTLPVPICLQI